MSFLLEKIKTASTEWFGKSDSYTVIYLLFILFGLIRIDVKHFKNHKAAIAIIRILQTVLVLACLYTYVAFVLDTYLLRHDVEKFTLSLCFTIFFLVVTVRVCITFIKDSQLRNVMDELGNDLYLDFIGKSADDLDIINNRRGKFERLLKIYSAICIFGNFFRIVCKMVDRVTLIPVPFIDNDNSEMYRDMFVLDVIAIYYLFTLYLLHETVVTGILIRIEQHYLILKKNITDMAKVFTEEAGNERVTDGKKGPRIKAVAYKLQQEKIFEMLKKSVIHHQRIIKIFHKVNNLYRESFLINVFGEGFLLIVLYFHLSLNTKSYTMTFVICQIIYWVGGVTDIIVVCFYGSKIQHMNQAAAQALYFGPWLKMNLNNRRMLRFIQMALWKDPKIRAGFTLSLDLKFFVSFLHSIYTYLAFMQNALNREQ